MLAKVGRAILWIFYRELGHQEMVLIYSTMLVSPGMATWLNRMCIVG